MCKKMFVVIAVAAVFFFAGSLIAVNKAAAEATGPKVEQPATSPTSPTSPEMTGEQTPSETAPGAEISPKSMEEPMAQPAPTPTKKKTAKRKPAQKKVVD
jgi:hypothetical protein